nr:hypothetical protein Iba_chr02cCG5490 [Ipomoea batatas]
MGGNHVSHATIGGSHIPIGVLHVSSPSWMRDYFGIHPWCTSGPLLPYCWILFDFETGEWWLPFHVCVLSPDGAENQGGHC